MADEEKVEEEIEEEIEEEEEVEEETTEPVEELDVNQEIMDFLVELKGLVINMQETIDLMSPPVVTAPIPEEPSIQEEPTDLQADLVKLDDY